MQILRPGASTVSNWNEERVINQRATRSAESPGDRRQGGWRCV
jgi:hypothetical protein